MDQWLDATDPQFVQKALELTQGDFDIVLIVVVIKLLLIKVYYLLKKMVSIY